MRLLTVNRNFHITGGPEKYMFSLMKAVEKWKFIPFAVDFPQNFKTPYSLYFVSPLSQQGASRFQQDQLSIVQKIVYAFQSIYSLEAKNKLLRLIDEAQPQAALFLNVVYFSQSIIDACRKRRLPIIWRLSDFNHICGNYHLYRNEQTCELCVGSGLHPLLKHRCGGYQRSLSAAMVRYIGMQIAKIRNIYHYVSFFICPSEFTRHMLIRAGFPPNKLIHLPTFISDHRFLPPVNQTPTNILFIGRFSKEKGTHILIESLKYLKTKNWRLILVGGTQADYNRSFDLELPSNLGGQIEFAGFIPPREIPKVIEQCHCCIVPSICYDNQPNTLLEAMSYGRPVIASRLGSLAETIVDGETGLLFEPGNPEDLAAQIDYLLVHPQNAHRMGASAYKYVTTNHNMANHISRLKQLFETAVAGRAYSPPP